ncbi:MAG: TIGR03621 family F420-dependent LLM class oxidoreductase [Frankiales bacterium]|nr:TIGR03621 family F420-dependent LLM class oxidoreductase [Frankiales bacterium]
MHPFRFAVQTQNAADLAAWRKRARDAEAMGYSTLLMPDHFTEQWGPIVGLTAAAEATERLKVGALVFDNDFRHPMELAKEMATLDLLYDGRVEFGLGAGWMKTDYDQSGIPMDEPGVRVDRMAEAITVFKGLFSGEPFSFKGEHYTLTEAVGLPRPAMQPHPPICIGGGSKRVLSIAAREADIVGFNASLRAGYVGPEVAATAVPEKFDDRVRWVREAAGDRFDSLELQCHTSFAMVVPNRQEIADGMAGMFGVDPAVALQIPIVLVGTIDEICETLLERRERWGFTYWIVNGDAMEAFAPVVERLAGT